MIWKGYFLRELMKVFMLFIGSFYLLYVLIDYSVHAKAFQSEHISGFQIIFYYLLQFIKRADILIPVALLIASIKVLTTASLRLEIVALAAGGLSFKKILSPFIITALFCSFFLYINFQWIQPLSLQKMSSFEELLFKNSPRDRESRAQTLLMGDKTLLIYQYFDPDKKAFVDVYWLKDLQNIFRIQCLSPYETPPLGAYVDELRRNGEGDIIKQASYDELAFPDMKLDVKTLFSTITPPQMQSYTQLARSCGGRETYFGMGKLNDREAAAATTLFYKLTIPLLSLLALIGPAPYCLRFSRSLPVFLIFALGLCTIIAFFTLINAFAILGENQVIAPIFAILLPQIPFFLVLGWNYAKL